MTLKNSGSRRSQSVPGRAFDAARSGAPPSRPVAGPAPAANTQTSLWVIFPGIMAVVAVGGLVIATVIQQSGMFSEPLSTSCLTLTTTAGTEKLQPSDGDLEKHQGANRNSVRLHVERCRPDDCSGESLKYYIDSVEHYAKSRMWDLQRMHKTFGPAGVDFMQRRFAESVSDRQIMASHKSMRLAGKLPPIPATKDWSIYYNLLIQSGGKPVPVCYKPKAQG